jgi:hypothetical protein
LGDAGGENTYPRLHEECRGRGTASPSTGLAAIKMDGIPVAYVPGRIDRARVRIPAIVVDATVAEHLEVLGTMGSRRVRVGPFSGKLNKVTIRVQPRMLTPAEEALLRCEGQRNNRASE